MIQPTGKTDDVISYRKRGEITPYRKKPFLWRGREHFSLFPPYEMRIKKRDYVIWSVSERARKWRAVKKRRKKNNKERERRGNEDKRAPIQGTSFGWDGYIRMHLRPHLASHLSIHPSPYYERRKEKKEGSSSPLAPPSFSDSRKTRMKTGGERATRNLRDKLIHHPQPKVKTTSAGVE